ncbi:MAG TPA: type II toxin-antitoxin system VapC family toxin [Actinophytocola sp.]|uniref:type II toxin-antitoxin system VapC family toxin n=1 Tax=Actinophytocola sp. TaxID=1872138 RepID=UPI002DDD6B32|nr:type II toxin-antitoxin system VapC family toxin [Actinophytocola sp.]HEV2780570.1 type II toxin-antitoxin system VapC family toxin [Actinophytocola sp.]
MIYVDSSALITLVVGRQHVKALRAFLDSHPTERTSTSTIGLIETVRTCDRLGTYPNLMRQLRHDHAEMPVTSRIRDAAADVPGLIRSLDAIHVATAELLGPELTALVTYDNRMAKVARDLGLTVAMPGME